jgi:hypothetical protein
MWQAFTSREGRFSVLFPGKPVHSEVRQPNETPGHVYGVTTRPAGGLFVGYYEYPVVPNVRRDVTRELDGARDGAIRNIQGTLESEKKISLNGNQGHEFVASTPMGVRLRARFYFVGNRLYTVLVTGNREEVDSPNTAKFLESFKLTR